MIYLTNNTIGQRDKICLLFLARTYPPLVGGMERFAQDFYQYMGKLCQITLLANPTGKKYIFLFFIKTLFFLMKNSKKYDIIHFNDAILAPLIIIVRLFSKAKITFTVHGLDIVYTRFGYQQIVIPFLRKADLIFPVSVYTKQQCIQRRMSPEKLKVIPNGLSFQNMSECQEDVKSALKDKFQFNFKNQIILLSLGRLIKRKGHVWFLENVFSRLSSSYQYIIAGNGPEFEIIGETISRLSLSDRVIQLGFVSETEKVCLFQMADLFIMPNITDQHDQEGFGIVLIEAASHGLPCIASDVEGIPDAVINGVTGALVREKNIQDFLNAINNQTFNHENIKQKIREKYNWENLSHTYHAEFKKLLNKNETQQTIKIY